MLNRFKQWRKARRNRCRITEEWGGLFIGRQHCNTHLIHWDGGGRCPLEGMEEVH